MSGGSSGSGAEGKNTPFLLEPAAKDYLWGGSRLNDDFNLGVDISPFAEAWVCSTHPDGQSTTADGVKLGDMIAIHGLPCIICGQRRVPDTDKADRCEERLKCAGSSE